MRLFIAASFPEEITRDLNAKVGAVKPKLPPASWVKPETQHLTFAFLGDRDESLVDDISPDLEKRMRAIPRFEATLHSCGLFPNARRARVGWVGLEPENAFIEVARNVREVLTQHRVELDRVDFKPHLTLMRLRDNWPPACVQMFEHALRDYKSAPFVVDSITLYSSRLNPAGAVHTPLRKFPLQ